MSLPRFARKKVVGAVMSNLYVIIRNELTFKGESGSVKKIRASTETEAFGKAQAKAGMEGEQAWRPPRARIDRVEP